MVYYKPFLDHSSSFQNACPHCVGSVTPKGDRLGTKGLFFTNLGERKPLSNHITKVSELVVYYKPFLTIQAVFKIPDFTAWDL